MAFISRVLVSQPNLLVVFLCLFVFAGTLFLDRGHNGRCLVVLAARASASSPPLLLLWLHTGEVGVTTAACWHPTAPDLHGGD